VAPDFRLLVRPGSPALVVVDEGAIPAAYWEPRDPRLTRQTPLAGHAKKPDCRCRTLQSAARLERESPVMSFSAKQVQALRRGLGSAHIRPQERN
jgi:hypothetical protein